MQMIYNYNLSIITYRIYDVKYLDTSLLDFT